MDPEYKRKNYFVHPSSQIKYVALGILPALIIGLFCIYFVIESGELIFKTEKEKLMMEVYSINETVANLEEAGFPGDETASLKKDLIDLRDVLKRRHFETVQHWSETKMILFQVLLVVLFCVAIIALLYSHRVAGPLFRLKRCIDMLAQGKDIPIVRFRRHDEFKELAYSLDKLREKMKEKGLLEEPQEPDSNKPA